MAGLALALVSTGAYAGYRAGTAVPQAVVVAAQPESSWAANFTEPVLPATYTLEELQSVPPMPLNMVVVGPDGLPAAAQRQDNGATGSGAPLQVTSGWDPQSGLPQPDPAELHTVEDAPVSLASWGSVPTNPFSGPYAPFQRWTWFGNYAVQSTQTMGVLFVDMDNNSTYDAWCTASVIGKRTIATTGSCISNGGSTYYYHFLFCPAWYKGAGSGAPQPGFGCWVAGSPFTGSSPGWHTDGDADRDFGCLLTNPVGDTYAGKVGDKTGWNAVAVNGGQNYIVFSFGYAGPSGGSGFPGYHNIADVSAQWYDVDVFPGGPVSHYIGSDLTLGANGGPWFIGFGHRTAEYSRFTAAGDLGDGAGTSQSFFTPWTYGLNSSRRCAGTGCGTYPPTATDGPFWAEMASPEFINDGPGGDTGQVLDIFSVCWTAES
jgi:hypothetical protein